MPIRNDELNGALVVRVKGIQNPVAEQLDPSTRHLVNRIEACITELLVVWTMSPALTFPGMRI